MIADVWHRRDLIAAGIALAGIALLCLGLLVDSAGLVAAGVIGINLTWVVLIVWRVIGGPGQGKPPGAA